MAASTTVDAGQRVAERAPPERGARADRQPGFRLGSIAGIEIRIDWSLAFIFFLIAFNLGAGVFPAWHPDWSLAVIWVTAFAAAILFFASVLAHELAHALVGRRHGVPVDGITLFIFGGIARLRGEPSSARAELFMAIVGPLTSIGLGVAFTLLGLFIARGSGPELPPPEMMRQLGPFTTLLLWLGPINVLLGVFNMLPGFPLDGGRVLRSALWGMTGDREKATRWAANVGRVLALGLVFLGALMIFGARVPLLGGGFVQGLWLVFIGWFLNSIAARSYQQAVIDELFRGVSVSRVMRASAPAVAGDTPLAALADRFLEASGERCLPVTDGERLLGVVCMGDLAKAPRTSWGVRTAREVMTPVGALTVVSPTDDAAEALRKIGLQDIDQLPVVENGRVRGLVRRADLLRWLELQRQGA